MANYRAYLLNEHGTIFYGEDLVAPGDEDAIDLAWAIYRQYNATNVVDAAGLEVWTGPNRVFVSFRRR